MTRIAILATLLALALVTVAAAATRTVTATESNGLGYSKSKLKVKAGKVTLKMVNPKSLHLDHSISIRGHGINKLGNVVGPGGTSTVKAKLKKGKTYTFYCHVSGHEADGMKGKVKVKG